MPDTLPPPTLTPLPLGVALELERQRANQLARQQHLLLAALHAIHLELCPGMHGTEPERIAQAVQAARTTFALSAQLERLAACGHLSLESPYAPSGNTTWDAHLSAVDGTAKAAHSTGRTALEALDDLASQALGAAETAERPN